MWYCALGSRLLDAQCVVSRTWHRGSVVSHCESLTQLVQGSRPACDRLGCTETRLYSHQFHYRRIARYFVFFLNTTSVSTEFRTSFFLLLNWVEELTAHLVLSSYWSPKTSTTAASPFKPKCFMAEIGLPPVKNTVSISPTENSAYLVLPGYWNLIHHICKCHGPFHETRPSEYTCMNSW